MSDVIDEKATDWLLRLNEADATAQDLDAFNAWYARDPRHREAYNKVAGLWSDLETLQSVIAEPAPGNITAFPARPEASDQPTRVKGRVGRPVWIGAIAACIALLLVFSTLEAPHYFADHSTATGQQSVIHLADGTIGYLNTDTAIDVSFGPAGRRINLLKGEALFEVAKDPARPFEVSAHGGRAVALGTTYAVRADMVEKGESDVVARAEVELVHQPVVVAEAPEPVEETAATEEAPARIKTGASVIIRRGDSLWTVSRSNYGEGVRYTTIYEANRDQIRNPHLIFPGQVLKLPDSEETTTQANSG